MDVSTSETDFARNIVSDSTAENFEVYRRFLQYFASSVDPRDQLPVRVPNYTLEENEISGAIIDWMIQYLGDKGCPQTLVTPIIKLAMDQTQQTLRKSPEQYGYLANTNEYQTLKLMQLSISKVNDVCQSLLDNLQLDKLITSPSLKRLPLYTAKGVKNTRRHMEVRHIIIDDFNAVFGIKDAELTSYYAIFDGHGGTDAAAYSVSHLHCEIAASKHYPSQPHEALHEAFINTDEKFIEKSKKQKLIAGTTALCCLYRPTERLLVVGWVGDSKALLVSQNRVLQIVHPHKPDSEAERNRIEQSGGCVLEFPPGCYRVNGRLAVSRAIGDYGLKDVVIGEPDITCLALNGKEDFLILACDGLWDFVEEDEVATHVYQSLEKNGGDVNAVSSQLIELAKRKKSSDNISVIVVFLKDPHQIIAEYKSLNASQVTRMDFESLNGCHHLDDGLLASNPQAHDETPSPDKLHVDFNKPTAVHDAIAANDFYFGKNGDDDFHSNINTIPSSITPNGDGEKFSSSELDVGRSVDDDHDDFGPETDVDATDDNAISPLSPSGYDFIERVGDDIATDEHVNIVKKSNDDDDIQHAFEDNRFVDHVTDHFVNTAAANHFEQQNEHFEDDEPELPNKIDFAEKSDYNGEFDEDDDDGEVHDVNADVESLHMPDVITAECEQHVLPTNNSVPIENVVVTESGDDSDDEWNYVKGNKEKADQDRETLVQLDDKEQSKQETEDDAIVTSPTPPTASLGETEFVNQESHAIAQAFAEPEEACSELHVEKQVTDPELLDLERVERSSSVADHDSDLGNDQDLEEMDSQLNPDAKEFVPVSPQRPPNGSPFGNGLHNRLDLMDDDVVSQSPRKGTVVLMDDQDIELPAENDFTEISQRPSELVNSELDFKSVQVENGEATENNDVQRPESSSSQCSYQEMNLKEAKHGDEKQELAAEHDSDSSFQRNGEQTVPTTNGGQQFLSEQDPMNMSFYNDENNPFKPQESQQEVDMNAVQQLPDDVEDEGSEDNFIEYVSRPIEVDMQRLIETDELLKEFASEGEKFNSDQKEPEQEPEPESEPITQEYIEQEQEQEQETIEQPTPITNIVQELATEATSILNHFDEQNLSAEPAHTEHNVSDQDTISQTEVSPDLLNRSDLSAHADEFVPSTLVDPGFDAVPSSVGSEATPEVSVPEPYVQPEQAQRIESTPLLNFGEPETESEHPIVLSEPEPEIPSAQPEPVTEGSETVAVAAAAVAATTAVAAAAVGVAKSAATKAKPTDAKKPEVKGRVAPIKKPTTTTTSKVAAKPTTAPRVSAVAPKVPSRTVASKVSTTLEKKTTTTTTTARKPLSNGTGLASSVAKKTTTSTVTKSTIGTARPATAPSKPATSRTIGASTTATKTTVSKAPTTTAPRVPLSARTVTKPASTTTASKLTATKTTTASTASTASRVKSAPAPSTLRSTTLAKPKTTVTKVSPAKPSTLSAARSPATKTSLGATTSASKITPTRKPLSTLTKTTPIKSPKVPTANGVASKTKVIAKTAEKEKVTNGSAKLNGHIEANGTGAEKIIDVSAD